MMTFSQRLTAPNDCKPIELSDILQGIKSGCFPICDDPKITAKMIKERLDSESDTNKKKALKESLPLFVAAGEFDYRQDAGLVIYSRYIVIDLDYKSESELRDRGDDWIRLSEISFVRAMFTSPSGGIKLIVRHNNDNPKLHKQLFGQICSSLCNDKVDRSGSNISRACFVSYDPDLYDNPNCGIFDFQPLERGDIERVSKRRDVASTTSSIPFISTLLTETEEMQVIKRVQSWSDANFPICQGSRHKHLYIFAQRLYELGISKQSAQEYLILKYMGIDKGDELTAYEIEYVVENGYLGSA